MPRPESRIDPRLGAYWAVAFVCLVAALVVGRPELVAAGTPFAVLAAVGAADRRSPRAEAAVTLTAERVLEGDEIRGEVTVDWSGALEVDVIVGPAASPVRVVEPTGGLLGWSLRTGEGPFTLPFRLRAETWGRHGLGDLWVRARRPWGLVSWEQQVTAAPDLRVLPRPLRLDRLLRPNDPRAVAGAHLSRRRHAGIEFAELRPYSPGDRLRDLSWSTSARLGTPWVVAHHPDRTGTVLVLLDAFRDRPADVSPTFERTARVAWAIVETHLHAQDRVGLVAGGRRPVWIPPQGGRRARWLLLEELLAMGAGDVVRSPRGRWTAESASSDALVLAVTTLQHRPFSRQLLHHRRTGRTTIAVVVDTSDLLPPTTDPVESAARRLWQAELDAERHHLARAGIPTALVSGDGSIAPAISSLRRAAARRGASR